MTQEPLLRVNLSAEYAGKPVLRDVRFDLAPGEVLGLVGSSGAGKSTLVFSLLGLLPWRGGTVSGEVAFAGRPMLGLPERKLRALRGRRIALIPQSPMTALNPAISLQRHFAEAWKAHSSGHQIEGQSRVRELLAEVKLPRDPDFLRRRPTEISVGQAQRVLIAMGLLHAPELIIADEPTSALDPVTQTQIVDLLKHLNRKHRVALLYVSHDLVSVLQLSDKIAVLDQGTIVETLPVGELDRARHPATTALLRALPVPIEILLRFRNRERNVEQEAAVSAEVHGA